MGKVNIQESIQINASAEKAWELIGPGFLDIQKWGRGIKKSWNNDKAEITIVGAPAGGRFCDLGKFGIAEEHILHYDSENQEITWSASSDKLPGFVKNLQNALSVEVLGDKTCRVTTNITADLTGIGGVLLGGPIKKNFGKLLKGFVKDWKSYAETGQASETKKRELQDLAQEK